MRSIKWLAVLGLVCGLGTAPTAQAQVRPYIGYVYPAGGQQGTTFHVKLGGQGLDDVNQALVSGTGVRAKIVEYYRRLGNQETTLLSEQLRELKRGKLAVASTMAPQMTAESSGMTAEKSPESEARAPATQDATRDLVDRIGKRLAENVQRPASVSIANLVFVEVTMDPDAQPGERELRLATPRGVSNPLVFHVGQLPEVSRTPMHTSNYQVLGKEELALRKRPADEVEQRISLPCTVNGQVASGEVNRYRFEARKGQRLLLTTDARQLIPFIADAVPGWFQPVLVLYDAKGKEVAYNDDYRFQPDPVVFFKVPQDGEYVLAITDAIYRGREDFVYRVTIGELPFVTSIFPLGGRAGAPVKIKMKGWNLEQAELTPPPGDAGPGIYPVAAAKAGFVSNHLSFALDSLPEGFDKEPNDDPAHAQKVTLPMIINGRIDRPDDTDVFRITGHAGDTLVAEVSARRLGSPLDSLLRVTDQAGQVLAFNDDHEDAGAGVNTHHADSYLLVKLPADGDYLVHLSDTSRHGGEEYAYRLRLSAPQPDFALRVVPSSVGLRSRSTATVSVYAIRKDGFAGAIKLGFKDPPEGFSATPSALSATQDVGKLTLKTDLVETEPPVNLSIVGSAMIEDQELVHQAVPAEDRMQAFLWKHLVPAEELKALVFNPARELPPKRVRTPTPVEPKPPTPVEPKPPTPVEPKPPAAVADPSAAKTQLSKKQFAGRVKQLKVLYEEGLLTDAFYDQKVAEYEAAQ